MKYNVMKNIAIVVAMLFAICLSSSLRAEEVQSCEVGFSIGANVPLGKFGTPLVFGGSGNNIDVKAKIGMSFSGEFRYNIKNTGWDVGAYYQSLTIKRSYLNDTQDNLMNVLGVCSHYNFGQGKTVNPFAGLGLGAYWHAQRNGESVDSPSGSPIAIMPRFGVELWHHLRITGEFQISREGFHSFGITAGFVIGGRPK